VNKPRGNFLVLLVFLDADVTPLLPEQNSNLRGAYSPLMITASCFVPIPTYAYSSFTFFDPCSKHCTNLTLQSNSTNYPPLGDKNFG